jgi:ATP-dependent helicase HrpA
MVKIRGDAVPIDYELAGGEGIARIRLREGQARRLRPDEVPALDRPVRFAVQRGRHAPLLADTVAELQSLLRRSPRAAAEDDASGRSRRHGGHRRRGPGGSGRRPRR